MPQQLAVYNSPQLQDLVLVLLVLLGGEVVVDLRFFLGSHKNCAVAACMRDEQLVVCLRDEEQLVVHSMLLALVSSLVVAAHTCNLVTAGST